MKMLYQRNGSLLSAVHDCTLDDYVLDGKRVTRRTAYSVIFQKETSNP
jgi:hypothetical protein